LIWESFSASYCPLNVRSATIKALGPAGGAVAVGPHDLELGADVRREIAQRHIARVLRSSGCLLLVISFDSGV
jgi:hypothetical protein